MTEKKELKVFTFNENNQPIRVKVFNDNLWFVAKDVAKALNISWSSATLAQIPEEWKGMMNFITPGGEQQLTVISEAGMYKLAFRCQSSERADKFTNWVAGEVLPTLRKTGKYEVKTRRLLPREKSREMRNFFEQLTHWTTTEDECRIAKMMNVTQKHVHAVVIGRSQSYGVACLLVEYAKDNRKAGVHRVLRNVLREADMKELMLEFTEE